MAIDALSALNEAIHASHVVDTRMRILLIPSICRRLLRVFSRKLVEAGEGFALFVCWLLQRPTLF